MIGYLLNTLVIGVLFADFLERRFPEYFKDFLLVTSYNCIYYFSKLQIILIKVKNQFNKLIDSNESLLKLKNDINKLNFYFHDKELKENNVDYCDGYNFYIYNYVNNNYVNRAIYYNDNMIPKNEVSDIKFMLIEFNIGEKSYKIDLKTDVFNYYLIGNKFIKDFFIYYIKKHININETIDDNQKFSLKIIDQNVNNVEIEFTDKNECVLLEKNEYKILFTS
jgi:hypothetical protein